LTAFSTMRRTRGAASPGTIFAAKKILRTSLRKAAPRRIASARRSAKRANRLSAIRRCGCPDRSCKRLTRPRRRSSSPRFPSARGAANAANAAATRRDRLAESDRAGIRDRASP
jgi:hypothetical protein